MHLAVPKHDVLVTILKHSVQCFHSIGSIYKPNYLFHKHTLNFENISATNQVV